MWACSFCRWIVKTRLTLSLVSYFHLVWLDICKNQADLISIPSSTYICGRDSAWKTWTARNHVTYIQQGTGFFWDILAGRKTWVHAIFCVLSILFNLTMILMWQLNLPTNTYKSSNNKKCQQKSTNLPTIKLYQQKSTNLPTNIYKSSNNKTVPTEIYKSHNKYLQIFQQWNCPT